MWLRVSSLAVPVTGIKTIMLVHSGWRCTSGTPWGLLWPWEGAGELEGSEWFVPPHTQTKASDRNHLQTAFNSSPTRGTFSSLPPDFLFPFHWNTKNWNLIFPHGILWLHEVVQDKHIVDPFSLSPATYSFHQAHSLALPSPCHTICFS